MTSRYLTAAREAAGRALDELFEQAKRDCRENEFALDGLKKEIEALRKDLAEARHQKRLADERAREFEKLVERYRDEAKAAPPAALEEAFAPATKLNGASS